MVVRNVKPIVVPMAVPMTKGMSERQCMSRQRPVRRWMLAAISSRKIEGMT
jgi:hypothetical protein